MIRQILIFLASSGLSAGAWAQTSSTAATAAPPPAQGAKSPAATKATASKATASKAASSKAAETAASATPAAPKLTLKESLEKGMDYSLAYKKAKSVVRQVKAEYRLAESTIFPKVNAVGSASTVKNPSNFTGRNFGSGTSDEDYRAYLQLKQPLYTGGALISGLSAAKISEDAAAQRLFEAKQNAAFEVIGAYLSAAEDQVLLTLAKDNASMLKSYLDITTRYAAIGRSKNIDRLQADANFALGQSEVLQRESDVQASVGDLQRLMGLEISPDTQLDTKLVSQPVDSGTLEQLLEKALANNPTLKALEMDIEKIKYSNDVTMSSHKPSLSLDGTWGYRSPDRPNLWEPSSNTYSVGLTLTVPLFSGMSSFADRARNAELVAQAEKNLVLYRDQVKQSLGVALTNLKRDFARLKLAQTASESARKAFDAAMRDYRQGMVSSTDVLNVQRSRYEAEKQFNSAQFSYQRQVLSLRRDLGIDLEKTYVAQ